MNGSCKSSRVIVKNIPKYATPEMVKKHFSKLPRVNITDVKIMKTPGGISRCFCFVGFHSESEAFRALEYFNKSFFDTCRIEVSIAKEVGSSELPRPWSKYTKSKSASDEKTSEPIKKKVSETEKQERATKFLESLDVPASSFIMKQPKKSMLWGNDDGYQNELTILPCNLENTAEESLSESEYGDNYDKLGQNTANNNTDANSEDEDEDHQIIQTPQESILMKNDEADSEAKRLFIRNLAFSCSKESLQELFSPFGLIESIHIPLSRESKFPKGIAFVTFASASSALDAYEKVDGTIFQGRLVHILPAKKPQTSLHDKQPVAENGTSSSVPHNPLFLKESNVAQSIAHHLGVRKEDFLSSRDGGSLAVRVALSEASLINLQKKHLEDNGINLIVFENMADPNIPKSDTCLLCKNIPSGTSEDELARLMGKFGRLCRFVFPANSSLAICEYIDSSEAKKAYASLLGSNFHSQPLLLSWSPLGVFKDESNPIPKIVRTLPNKESSPEQENNVKTCSLYIKNLSFHTNEQTLLDFFRSNMTSAPSKSKIRSVRIPKKHSLHKNDGSDQLSLGFGFVEFETPEACKLALDKLQGAVLDGHQLELSFSNQSNSSQKGDNKLKHSIKEPPSNKATRLLVKNVPFEATEKELRELFGSFVQIKRVRLPKKFGGQHRGFAFVDCATHNEACDAFALLGNVHLYGRHLVIEWALDQGTADEIIEKLHPDDLAIYE